MSSKHRLVCFAVSAFIAQAAHASGGPAACEALGAQGAFDKTTVGTARIVPADASKHLPSFCEVTASVKPVEGSNITVVYRLPDNWNGKLLGLGGGGWAGNILPVTAAPGLAKGYATAQTNGGHDVANVWDTAWAVNPEASIDFSYRAIHVMTDLGKQVVAKYYGEPQKRAYFQGCSTGGRQGLMEVQRFPKDYDGVIAGAPVYTLRTQTSAVVRNQIFAREGANVTREQLTHLHDAALAACDGKDGLVDGIVTDPRSCVFDPAIVQCDAHKEPNCLTPVQVKAVRDLYAGRKLASGETVAYGLTRGSEAGWALFISATAKPDTASFLSGASGQGLGGLRAQLFGNPDFDLQAFNPDKDYVTLRDSRFAAEYEAKDPDISPFINAGGKLLMWHGMDDPGPNVVATIEYYEQMKSATAAKVKSLDSSARFFVLPGVYHCRGGPGADDFDSIAALDSWVEHGVAPNAMKATRSSEPVISRPVCQYPTLPRYNSKGDPNAAENFHCK
ncbi:MAG: tannase/feruloyl esterase family alpha/beta hydrolase [Gammaproteobacteria bacterium]